MRASDGGSILLPQNGERCPYGERTGIQAAGLAVLRPGLAF